MKFPFYNLFTKRKTKKPLLHKSNLLKKIKSFSDNKEFKVFKHVKIFYHTTSIQIPLLAIDIHRGLYVFEIKSWNYAELKNASIQKAQSQKRGENTLAFDNIQNVLKQKFKEITHNQDLNIFNYLLMEKLTKNEYLRLNNSIKELLPESKLIFCDNDDVEITQKLQNATKPQKNRYPINYLTGVILTQYTLLINGSTYLCSDEQIDFIDHELSKELNLIAPSKSGKTSVLLLKAIKEIFENNYKDVIFIKQNTLAKDLLQKQLINIIEHGIIEFDLNSLTILTPQEYKKSNKQCQLLICDDADMLLEEFISEVMMEKKYRSIITVNKKHSVLNYKFKHSYNMHTTIFMQTNPYAKALNLISSLSSKNKTILVVAKKESIIKISEDLETFIEKTATIIDVNKHLLEQTFSDVLLSDYEDTDGLCADYIIAFDVDAKSLQALHQALNRSKVESYVLYDEFSLDVIQTYKQEFLDEKTTSSDIVDT